MTESFYHRTDVVQIARELLGKVLVTEFEGRRTSGRIVETEAYRAPDDRACHAYGNRRTTRTEVMFQEGGRSYIYLCYGIHHLFNVVTGPEGMAHAVLVRALAPMEGIGLMTERRLRSNPKAAALPPKRLTLGPGTLSEAMGLRTDWNGQSLVAPGSPIWIADDGQQVSESDILAGPRIGVGYAGECAEWPWRFWLR